VLLLLLLAQHDGVMNQPPEGVRLFQAPAVLVVFALLDYQV
jgi:hypothetical protein